MRNELVLSPVDFLLRRTNHMLFMRDSLDSIVEPVLDEMGRFYDWTEEEKAAYRVDVEVALANNDLAELKIKKKKGGGGQGSLVYPSFFLMETER